MFKFNKKVYITLYIAIILLFSISCKNNITDGNQNTNDLGNYAGVYKSATYDINIGSDGSITVAESGAQSINGTVESKEGNKYTIKLDNGTQIIIEFLDNGSVTITKPDGTTESATKTDNTGGQKIVNLTVYCGSKSLGIDTNSDYSHEIKDLWLSVYKNKKIYLNKKYEDKGGDKWTDEYGNLYYKSYQSGTNAQAMFITNYIYTLSYTIKGDTTIYNTNYVSGVYSNTSGSYASLIFIEGDWLQRAFLNPNAISSDNSIDKILTNGNKTINKNPNWIETQGSAYKGYLKDY